MNWKIGDTTTIHNKDVLKSVRLSGYDSKVWKIVEGTNQMIPLHTNKRRHKTIDKIRKRR